MNQIRKEAYEKFEIEIIDKGRYFWVNRKHLEIESDYKNWAQIFNKCGPERQNYRHELTADTNVLQCKVFVRNDLVERESKSCRKA